tara:strand:+ start:228 stop:623 length:396 start_codon:yes stop_codon:yes gene_type:complete
MKNILRENMRRFGTKNLHEGTGSHKAWLDVDTGKIAVDIGKMKNLSDDQKQELFAVVAKNWTDYLDSQYDDGNVDKSLFQLQTDFGQSEGYNNIPGWAGIYKDYIIDTILANATSENKKDDLAMNTNFPGK